MNTVKFNIKLTPQEEAYRKRLIERLWQDARIQKFLEKYQLDIHFVENNTSYLEDWLENVDRCKGCRGLDFCRQNVTGLVKELFMDDYNCVSSKYRPCRHQQKLNKETNHEEKYRLSHLSKKDYLVDFNKISLENESTQYFPIYIQVKNSLEEEKGIYLCGIPGVGKSYLMMCVSNYYAKKGKRVSFVKVPQLISDLKSNFNEYDYQRDILNDLYYSEVLILDDLGSESISKWARDTILFPILDFRMERKLKTYFTSNLDIKQLEEKYAYCDGMKDNVSAKRIIERINTLSNCLELKGNSRR
ncbi:MAG: ATP-binding protein [Bacillota bacterium]|nr:ATP-binding protein [Bacillota bacterium]